LEKLGGESESKGNTRETQGNVGKSEEFHCVKGWGKTSQMKFRA